MITNGPIRIALLLLAAVSTISLSTTASHAQPDDDDEGEGSAAEGTPVTAQEDDEATPPVDANGPTEPVPAPPEPTDPPDTLTLELTVVESDTEPFAIVPFADVTVTSLEGDLALVGKSDENGVVTIEGVPRAKVELLVVKQDYKTFQQDFDFTDGQEQDTVSLEKND